MCQCGNKIQLHEVRIKSRTEDARELAMAVAAENAKLSGGMVEYRHLVQPPKKLKGVHGLVAGEAAKETKKDDKIRVAATELTKRLGTFTAKDFILVVSSLGIARPHDRLKELLDLNCLYEPEPGRYRVV